MASKDGPLPARPSPMAPPHTYWSPTPTHAAGPSRPLPWGTPSPGCLPHPHPLSDVFRFTSDVAPAAAAPPPEPIEPRFRSSGNTAAAAAAIRAATRDGGGRGRHGGGPRVGRQVWGGVGGRGGRRRCRR
eukprot:TRINITY_DN1578_c0_g1_i5.p4 TRINITY_DN1578_c0_g1~~TRINITY_DN1578_c0_g1_i5.p4  ORF type:complete len:130 (+),score=11.94 TRINITY_DN1578_c0_g1_i5:495-884(+)